MLPNQRFDGSHRLLHAVLRRRREDHRRIQHLSGRIHNSKLTAGTKRRVPAKHYMSCDGRLHQKLFQILAKYMNCSVLCLFSQVTSDLTLDCRCDQTLIAVFCYFF